MGSIREIFSEFGPNAGYVEDLYNLYLVDPALVGASWVAFFSGLAKTNGQANGAFLSVVNGARIEESRGAGSFAPSGPTLNAELQAKVFRLIEAYRNFGHFKAKINPLSKGVLKPSIPSAIDIQQYQFKLDEQKSAVAVLGFQGQSSLPLSTLIAELDRIYCGSIGFEFNHLINEDERHWLQESIEKRSVVGREFSPQQKIKFLQKLIDAEAFETALHRKYVGQKWFSAQGAETLIPMLADLLETAGAQNVREVVVGSAHRARLNVLANIFGKPLEDIFGEFEDVTLALHGSGDVKYHLGYHSTFTCSTGAQLPLTLASNPSHLEFVNPVLEGIVRAKQDTTYSGSRHAVLPVIMHGDAAFAGQGVVYEALNFSQVDGYESGGTIHVVINNQVGFTTNPQETRSTPYCTDIAKGFDIPIFHVNSEDIEAAAWVAKLAVLYRQRFAKDVVIDLYCYRKYGHNESDDPTFTQPLLYEEIHAKKPLSKLYSDALIAQGLISDEEVSALFKAFQERFESAQKRKPTALSTKISARKSIENGASTKVANEILLQVANTLTNLPEDFVPHQKLKKLLEKRVETLVTGKGIDWGFAEALAFGSLVLDGHSVRLSGQDTGRGTFSQRHLALSNLETQQRYLPFSQLESKESKARFEVYNSTLSEAGIVGFEFGYAAIATRSLVLWEAQFGDFANGAQVIIDQFIAASEAKWNQTSGVVLLLPHGFEGQGPEHSSARLERFLQLCADNNMTVCYPSRASQHFHMLRRQALSETKRPLIVMTPKSLLRHPGAACEIAELTAGKFEPILVTESNFEAASTNLAIMSGKVFYDVSAALEKEKAPVKIIRIEQLYPFPSAELKAALKGTKLKSCFWVQEEPQNMGAWAYVEPRLRGELGLDVSYIGRPAAASPATGSGKRHAAEQQALIQALLNATHL